MEAGIDKRALGALSGGHLAVDFASGSLPALLPFLVVRFSLSYTFAAALMLAGTVSSSLAQPVFGAWSDRHGAIWLLPAGVAVAGIGIALAADAPSYWLCVVLIVVSGLGIAAYHPEASKLTAYVSGRRRASGMSAFSIGGNLGFALGPVIATPLVLGLGLRGGLLLALPCVAVAAGLAALVPLLQGFGGERAQRAVRGGGDDQPGALAILLAATAFRSIAWYGLLTFVPLWEVSLGHSKSYGSHLLAAMLLAGGIGTILAGPAADRFGLRRVLTTSLVATPALIAGYVVVGGAVGTVCLAGVGIAVISTYGVTMVMAQQYLPRRVGLASGLSIGVPVGLGGVGAVVLGALADSVDLRAAMEVSAAVSVVAVVVALFLPSSGGARAVRLTDQSIAPS